MAGHNCHLTTLPADVQYEIIQLLLASESADTVRNLSCVCSSYRDLLAPHVFKAIVLANNSKSGDSISAVATGRYAQHVRELHYRGSAPGHKGNHPFRLRTIVFLDGQVFEDVACLTLKYTTT